MTDFFARPKRKENATNVSELLRSEDKRNIMRLLGCEEKYLDGSCSDFEFFAQWESVLPLCAGTGVHAVYGEEKRLLGLPEAESLCDAWKRGNEFLQVHASDFTESGDKIPVYDLSSFVSEVAIRCFESHLGYESVSREWCQKICDEKSNSVHVVFFTKACGFQKPNSYHASLYWQNMSDENYDQEKMTVIGSQLLIDGLLALKKCKKKAILHLRSANEKVGDALAAYLTEHSLIEGEIRMSVSTYGDPTALAVRAEGWGSRKVTPELVLSVSELDEGLEDRLYGLFCAYPAGGLRFGGILTDAPLIEAYHRSFDRRFRTALSRLGADEEAVARIAEHFYSSDNG